MGRSEEDGRNERTGREDDDQNEHTGAGGRTEQTHGVWRTDGTNTRKEEYRRNEHRWRGTDGMAERTHGDRGGRTERTHHNEETHGGTVSYPVSESEPTSSAIESESESAPSLLMSDPDPFSAESTP